MDLIVSTHGNARKDPTRFLKVSLILSLLLFIAGCYWDEYIPGPVEPPPDVVSFSMDIIPIFDADCNSSSCHAPGAIAPDLTSANAFNALETGGFIDRATPENSELYQWMLGNRSIPMPIDGAVPTYNALVLAWIEQGALNN